MQFIDTHAHLDDEAYSEDLDHVISRAQEQGVTQIINIAQDIKSSKRNIELSKIYKNLFPTAGVHPHLAKEYQVSDADELLKMAQNGLIVAIGEIGLDYHYNFSTPDNQIDVLKVMLDIASETKLPVIIHSRESDRNMLNILEQYNGKVNGVIHCFSGNYEMLSHVLDYGYYISVAGPVTFKKSDDLRAILKKVPMDRLLTETDSPYLTPVPYRGKRNEPFHVKTVSEFLADWLNIDKEIFAQRLWDNAHRLFNIPLT